MLPPDTKITPSNHSVQRYHERKQFGATARDVVSSVTGSRYLGRRERKKRTKLPEVETGLFYLISDDTGFVFLMRRLAPGDLLVITCYSLDG
jgi:hypothetical protein